MKFILIPASDGSRSEWINLVNVDRVVIYPPDQEQDFRVMVCFSNTLTEIYTGDRALALIQIMTTDTDILSPNSYRDVREMLQEINE